ncbi:hypothetical protein EYZ11_011495 [Aspergillus tanneri]|uniref:Uncharacterized protein n=1 Tax=Aspergillus tanneri TaxID=1220188 RepID=A0A4S3J303_9EURO|nr:hypothetical protein EYZ11_011495 [Aspergillus tanneri]
MLQHASIDTFVKHYSVGIHVDAQAIVRRLPAQKQLMRFAASISRSIDPRQPYKLDDTSHVNEIPRFRNEWQRQRNRLVRENLERYKNEQPVIDSERQLSGKLVDEEVLGALERTGGVTKQTANLTQKRKCSAIDDYRLFPRRKGKNILQRTNTVPLFVKQLRLSALQLQMKGRRSASYALEIPDFRNMND